MILEAATGARTLSDTELQQVLDHIARAVFTSGSNVRATGLAGFTWNGRVLRGSDRITAVERHYLEHVVKTQEWPVGTTLQQYLNSIRDAVLDPGSGVLSSRYAGQWQVSIVQPSGGLAGPAGGKVILVEYRVGLGYWVTAYQPAEGIRVFRSPRRTDRRWLRRPHAV